MRADLAVLDRNIFAPNADPIADARVEMTLSGGVTVYQSA
jgi:predicted amidohydrolase YtcJ